MQKKSPSHHGGPGPPLPWLFPFIRGLLSAPPTRQAHSCLRAFALSPPASWNAPPVEICRDASLSVRPLLTTLFMTAMALLMPHQAHPFFSTALSLAAVCRMDYTQSITFAVCLPHSLLYLGHRSPGFQRSWEGRDVVWSA